MVRFVFAVAVVLSKGAFCPSFVKRRLGYAHLTKMKIKKKIENSVVEK